MVSFPVTTKAEKPRNVLCFPVCDSLLLERMLECPVTKLKFKATKQSYSGLPSFWFYSSPETY